MPVLFIAFLLEWCLLGCLWQLDSHFDVLVSMFLADSVWFHGLSDRTILISSVVFQAHQFQAWTLPSSDRIRCIIVLDLGVDAFRPQVLRLHLLIGFQLTHAGWGVDVLRLGVQRRC